MNDELAVHMKDGPQVVKCKPETTHGDLFGRKQRETKLDDMRFYDLVTPAEPIFFGEDHKTLLVGFYIKDPPTVACIKYEHPLSLKRAPAPLCFSPVHPCLTASVFEFLVNSMLAPLGLILSLLLANIFLDADDFRQELNALSTALVFAMPSMRRQTGGVTRLSPADFFIVLTFVGLIVAGLGANYQYVKFVGVFIAWAGFLVPIVGGFRYWHFLNCLKKNSEPYYSRREKADGQKKTGWRTRCTGWCTRWCSRWCTGWCAQKAEAEANGEGKKAQPQAEEAKKKATQWKDEGWIELKKFDPKNVKHLKAKTYIPSSLQKSMLQSVRYVLPGQESSSA